MAALLQRSSRQVTVMAELMDLVVKLIKLRADIITFSSMQPYMLAEAEDLENQILHLSRKMDKEAML